MKSHKKKTKQVKRSNKKSKQSIASDLSFFIHHLQSLRSTIDPTISAITASLVESTKELDDFRKKYFVEKEQDGEKFYLIKPEHHRQFRKLVNNITQRVLANKIIPSSFIVSLISQYDAFLGQLIRTIYSLKPELLNSSDKEIKFTQLLEYHTLAQIKSCMIEKDIECVLRKSHSEQFEWLENKYSIPLRKELHIWPMFIEITERRNLLVHCNGIVSSQYLKICKEHKVNLDKSIKQGKELIINKEYFKSSYDCVFELAVKLAHVLWRKLLPDETESADQTLNDICYDLIEDDQYNLSIALLDFATETIKKHHSDESRRTFIINRAQAYKWKGNNTKSISILSKEDWSATSEKFKLAEAVLKDEFSRAADIMRELGPDGKLNKSVYRDWPLFKEFRKSPEFQKAFHDVFKESFNKPDSEPEGELPKNISLN
jgi:hypothetical protein